MRVNFHKLSAKFPWNDLESKYESSMIFSRNILQAATVIFSFFNFHCSMHFVKPMQLVKVLNSRKFCETTIPKYVANFILKFCHSSKEIPEIYSHLKMIWENNTRCNLTQNASISRNFCEKNGEFPQFPHCIRSSNA